MSIAVALLHALDRARRPSAAHAHCDLPCGVYDPAQARIEAESRDQLRQAELSDDLDFEPASGDDEGAETLRLRMSRDS